MLLGLLLVVVALAQPAAIVRGANGDHKHCESGREVAQLLTDRLPDLSFVHPSLELYVDEEQGAVSFSVEVPYIPFDVRYVISFDPIEHAAETPLVCSSNYDAGDNNADDRLWTHAPNANYRDAFSVRGAYYTHNSSKWIARASGCSHVKFAASFNVDQLTECVDSAGRFSVATTRLYADEPQSSVSLIGVVWISLLQPSERSTGADDTLSNAVVVAKWSHPFSITVDPHESKIVLIDSANGGTRRRIDHAPATLAKDASDSTDWPRAATVMRKATVTKDGKLDIQLQTLFVGGDDACQARNLTLGQIGWREFEFEQRSDEGAYCIKTTQIDENGDEFEVETIAQSWRLRSKSAASVYDGDFVLLFCDAELDEVCDEGNAVHRTTLGVRMSRQSVETADAVSFQSEITQHNTADETKQRVGEFESDSRACMQSYVIGPKELTSQIEVLLLEAWLCVDNDEAASEFDANEFDCAGREGAVRLVGIDSGKAGYTLEPTRNVVVHHPGIYGLQSVGVCFDVDARFVYGTNRSVINPRQRYESRVQMQPATIRRNGPMHITPLFPLVSTLALRNERAYDPSIGALAAHVSDQSLQKEPFASSVLLATLDTARKYGIAVETHAHRFSVRPALEDAKLVSAEDGAIGLFLTICIVALFALALCVFATSIDHFMMARPSSIDD